MSKVFKFGEEVEGYNIPVLNEREIRAAAGILFVLSASFFCFSNRLLAFASVVKCIR